MRQKVFAIHFEWPKGKTLVLATQQLYDNSCTTSTWKNVLWFLWIQMHWLLLHATVLTVHFVFSAVLRQSNFCIKIYQKLLRLWWSILFNNLCITWLPFWSSFSGQISLLIVRFKIKGAVFPRSRWHRNQCSGIAVLAVATWQCVFTAPPRVSCIISSLPGT